MPPPALQAGNLGSGTEVLQVGRSVARAQPRQDKEARALPRGPAGMLSVSPSPQAASTSVDHGGKGGV